MLVYFCLSPSHTHTIVETEGSVPLLLHFPSWVSFLSLFKAVLSYAIAHVEQFSFNSLVYLFLLFTKDLPVLYMLVKF